MWAVLSIASFGITWFPMIYYSIKRRNDHFTRQAKLEELIIKKLGKNKNHEKSLVYLRPIKKLIPKNEKVLTLSTLLIIPAFYIFYFLKNDLQKHEEQEHNFLVGICALAKDFGIPLKIQSYTTTPSFGREKYVVLSVLTFGLAGAYWLYRMFNDYNNHFKMQWLIEDELLRFLKEVDQKSS